MSIVTTPERAARMLEASPASTRGAKATSPQLTPRSKIKAMLAAIDDDSGSELEHDQRPSDQPYDVSATTRADSEGEQSNNCRQKMPSVFPDEEEAENVVPLKPRGHLAALLNSRVSDSHEPSTIQGSDSDKENAYARVRKQLMKKKQKRSPTKSLPKGPKVRPELLGQIAVPSPHDQSNATSMPVKSRPEEPPGLFLTPGSAAESGSLPQDKETSDSDLPTSPHRNSKFLELVARKKAEREAKQAEQSAKKQKKQVPHGGPRENSASHSSAASDDEEVDKRLEQHDRPARKASKKALEEMSRETQRMSRNMQLAHQAKTKKKITKESLLARFSFAVPAPSIPDTAAVQAESTTASSLPASDHEVPAQGETPPTSPLGPDLSELDGGKREGTAEQPLAEHELLSVVEAQAEEFPSMADVLSQPLESIQKGKGKEKEGPPPSVASQVNKERTYDFKQRPIRVHLPKRSPKQQRVSIDSDSDLEVMPLDSKPSRMDVFDRIPKAKVQDVRSLQTLRALAHLKTSPDHKGRKSKQAVSQRGMQMSLQKRARQQALEERNAKIADLKARGIIIQTAEEKQQEQVEVEDLLEKARRKNEEIREREKKAAKKAKLANGETIDADSSDEDDEDYEEGGDVDAPELDLSGSEEEELDEEMDADEDQKEDAEDDRGEQTTNGLIDEGASDDSREEADIELEADGEESDVELDIQRRRRNRMVVDDDDEDEGEDDDRKKMMNRGTIAPADVDKVPSPSRTDAVEVPKLFQHKPSSLSMGMTQAFAATMADEENSDSQELLEALGPPPEPKFPILHVEDSLRMVEDTQDRLPQGWKTDSVDSMRIDLHTSQIPLAQGGDVETQTQPLATQLSEIPDPTQDAGFVMSSPAPEQRFISEPPSTVDTVIIPGPGDGSPKLKKRGRLQRRMVEQASDDDQLRAEPSKMSKDAFTIMKKARKGAEQRELYDKKKSEAKEMVEDQAQESEDEYAGLGGASDDESGGEDDAFVKEMIDQGEVDVDEGKLAAFYADKQRLEDGKAVEKLFKDINNGGLRRKRNNEFDLSDSEDEAEARRRRKQREFAKMRKALLENENVGKIAEDPKKMAFLKAIEDREDDEDNIDFPNRPAEDSFKVEMDTQEDGESQSQKPAANDAPEETLKRPLQEAKADATNMRPPATSRRTHIAKKPTSLSELRDSVSFLVEEPGSLNLADNSSSSSDEEDHPQPPTSHDKNQSNPRRTSSNPVIDRLTLKRQSSSSLSTTTAAGSTLAFHAPTTSTTKSFVPSLLRRATTSSLSNSNSQDANGISHATTERAAGGGEKGDFVRRGGTKRSSVNFAAREMERKRGVEGVDRRRREKRERIARERGKGLVGLSRGSTWEG